VPVALGWLSLGTLPFCHSVPFGPVNLVAHNGLLILSERVGGKTTPVYKSVVGLGQAEWQLPDSLLLFSSRLPKLPSQGERGQQGRDSHGQLKAQWEESSPRVLFQDRTATGIIFKVSISHP